MKRQGSLILRDRAPRILSNLNINPSKESTVDKNKNVSKLTASETQRNIGSVTFFLDGKVFEENLRSKNFSTTEMWLPIRDITVAPNVKLSVSSILIYEIAYDGICVYSPNDFQLFFQNNVLEAFVYSKSI